MSFEHDFKRFGDQTIIKLDNVVKEIVREIALSLIVKSPVGDAALWQNKPRAGYKGGQFRANWQYGEGSPNNVTTNAIDPDGGSTLDRIVGSITEDAAGKFHFITNSLPYAQRLENGWSTQAPFGMVTLTAIEFHPIIAKAIDNVKHTTIGGRGFGL